MLRFVKSTSTNPLLVLSSYDAFQQKPQGHPGEVQNQIVHIEGAQKGYQLQQFHRQHDGKAQKEEPQKVSKGFGYLGQQKADGNKQQHISSQIDKAVADKVGVVTMKYHPKVVADGEKGLEIPVVAQLLFIGKPFNPAGRASEEEPQHKNAV